MISINTRKDPYLSIYVNSFIINAGDFYILIDSGLHQNHEALTASLHDDKVVLLCTHGHWDHIGNHYVFKDAGATLLAHPGDARYFEDYEWHWNTLFGQFTSDFELPDARQKVFFSGIGQPTKPEYSLSDDLRLKFGDADFSVLHTPGHSNGSVCFLEMNSGALFTGDCLMGDGFFHGIPQYCRLRDYIVSMERLMHIEAEVVFCDHNAPFNGNQLASKAQQSIECAMRIDKAVRGYVNEHQKENDISLGKLAEVICRSEEKNVGAGALVTALAHLAEIPDAPSCVQNCLSRYTYGV